MRKLKLELLTTLLLMALSLLAPAQDRTVTGTVRDEKGGALPGATITVKGTKTYAISDGDGHFKITVPSTGKVLVVSYVGMQIQEVKILGLSNVDIAMQADNTAGDTVVIAYGRVSKRDLTGAVGILDGKDLVKGSPTNIMSAIQGKIAGVTVTQSDGAPGSGLSLVIRGVNSVLTGTQPLYVIDGIPFVVQTSDATPGTGQFGDHSSNNPLAFLNTLDIESISFLKDASATAIYGARAANGVVMITTKKGRQGDQVSVASNLGVSKVIRKIKVLDAYGYALMQNEANSNANYFEPGGGDRNLPYPGTWQPSATNPDSMVYFKGPKDFIGHSNDWQKDIFHTGVTSNNTLTFSGGDDKGNYLLSASYLNQSGVIQDSRFQQYAVRLNLTRNVKSWLTVGTNTSFNKSTNQMVRTNNEDLSGGVGVVKAALAFAPTAPIYDSGTNVFTQATQVSNPVMYVGSVKNRVLVSQIYSANYMEFKLGHGITFRQNLGLSFYNNQREQYYPRTVNEGLLTNGLAYQSQGWYTSTTTESLLSYAKTFGQHIFNALAGFTYDVNWSSTKNQQASNFANDVLQDYSMAGGANYVAPSDNVGKKQTAGFLVRVTDSWKDRYLITLSMRRDGSSVVQPQNRWSTFPSGAFAWRLSNEPFMQDILKHNEDIKIRFGYGKTGNININAYQTLTPIIPNPYVFSGTLVNGYADNQYAGLGNETLKWETTDQYDAGIDLGLLNNKLSFHADLYYKRTHNLLQNITVPASSGFQTEIVNSGEISNKGAEFTVSATPITTSRFSWDINGNISFNRNRIVSLGGSLKQQFATRLETNGDQPFIQKAGHPIGALYGYVEQDIYKNEAEVRSDPFYASQPDAIIARAVGEIHYKDLNHDGNFTNDDQTFIGDVNPKFTYGLSNNFTIGKFDVNVFIQGVYGNDIVNMNTYFLSNIGGFNNVTQKMWNERWTFTNWEHAGGPKAEAQYWRKIYFTRRFVEDGSYIRLRNISVGYNIKTHVKLIQSLRVYANANNLLTITKYSGYDPDVNGYGDDSRRGVDMGGYPSAKTFNVGFQCGF